jgi:hypothetical protein
MQVTAFFSVHVPALDNRHIELVLRQIHGPKQIGSRYLPDAQMKVQDTA